MKNILFLIIGSFLPLALLARFAEANSMAQPQIGQPQKGTSQVQGLASFSLPSGTITENDMPKIKAIIPEVLTKINESIKPGGKKVDYQTIKSGIIAFQDWLKGQGCISQASTTYDIENTDKYYDNIFITHPGQLPFDITFNMDGGVKRPYRLLIFASTAELFSFASLVENKSIGGVPVPKSWPKDTLSYWENKL